MKRLWGTCFCAKSGFPIPLPKTSRDRGLDWFYLQYAQIR